MQWKQSEIDYLTQNVRLSCEEMGIKLGRTTRSVQHKFNELGLSKPRKKVGDIINGWKIIEIFEKEKYGQQISFAKLQSTLSDNKIRTVKLTILNKEKIGWPDRRRPDLVEKNTTHGLSKHPLMSVWCGIKARCLYPSQESYKNYGERGIKICDEWLIFKNFYDWAINNGWKKGLQIDRIDNDGNYEPSNCKFVSRKTNIDNRRVSIIITAFGETKNASDWSLDSRCNVSYATLCSRIKNNWKPELALTKFAHTNKKKDNFRKYKELYNFIKDCYPDILNEFLQPFSH